MSIPTDADLDAHGARLTAVALGDTVLRADEDGARALWPTDPDEAWWLLHASVRLSATVVASYSQTAGLPVPELLDILRTNVLADAAGGEEQ